MNKHLPAKHHLFLFALATILFVSSSALGAVTITIKNNDAAGVGFNDPTPVSPIGGNGGTTLGQQRLIAAQNAADIWGEVLTSNVPIVIGATWRTDMPCEDTGATLASAGSNNLARNFPGGTLDTLYPMALANALSGTDRNGTAVEISARFNARIGQAGCLSTRTWYNGLDNNHGSTGIDLVTVALHEFGHGLGFASFTDETNGVEPLGLPSVYDLFLKDNTTGKLWPNMTDSERVASAINSHNVVWIGSQVTASVPGVLSSGFDLQNHPPVFTPNPVSPGSSVSHWDTILFPNQLMEPNITNSLTHNVSAPQDLTLAALIDIGWGATGGPTPTPTPTPSAPANDNFVSAQAISGCTGSVTGTNVGATHESGEPDHLPAPEGGTHSVWYVWQAPASVSVTIDTLGSGYDTVLAVYTGTAVSNLGLVARNDDKEPFVVQASEVTFSAVGGTIYKIAVDGYNDDNGGDVGPIKLNWNQNGCLGPIGVSPQILLEDSGPAGDQAAIYDSILHVRDPFVLVNTANLFNPVSDQNTRVVIFVANLPGTSTTGKTITLVDGSNQLFEIAPIDVHEFTEFPFSQVTFRLPTGMSSGTCRLRVFSNGQVSNTATFRML
jgi:hypothetical protein